MRGDARDGALQAAHPLRAKGRPVGVGEDRIERAQQRCLVLGERAVERQVVAGVVRAEDRAFELERREDSSDENAQQLSATLALADRTIVNDGTLADLEARVARLLEELHA